jgi:predicted methyltransferase
MIRYPLILAAALAASLSLSACMHEPGAASAPSAPSAATNPGYISAAVADTNRPDSDKLRDANRKPAQTLDFLGVKPGEQIAEILPGGG